MDCRSHTGSHSHPPPLLETREKGALHYITLHYIMLRYVMLRYVTLWFMQPSSTIAGDKRERSFILYITLHYITLCYVTLHYGSCSHPPPLLETILRERSFTLRLHYITLCDVTLHPVTLYYIMVHTAILHHYWRQKRKELYIKLRYVTLHYIVWLSLI